MDLKVQIVVPPPVFLFFFFFISYEFQVGNTTYFHDPCGPHDYTDTFFFFFVNLPCQKTVKDAVTFAFMI